MSKNQLAIIILAAGQGKRMKSVKPKVMHELAGLPMINWLLGTAESLKPQKIIVVTGPGMLELVHAVKPHATAVQAVRNGTAGALRVAMPALKNFKGDLLVLLGDAPLVSRETLQKLVKLRRADKKTGLTVLGTYVDDATGYGRLVTDQNGFLEKIVEQKDASTWERDISLINTGAFCIDGAKLPNWLAKVKNNNAAKEFYITDLPAIAAKDGALTKVHVSDDADEVQGCNSRADLAALEFTVQNYLRADAMANGVTMLDPMTVYLQHDTVIGKDSLIEPNVFFGSGVKIGEGAVIKAFSHIEGAKIASGAKIGPFARLRPGSELGADVRIGNFVEIKKAKIGRGSKINHLSYVGDCTMGENVNFGCGAITVNYDGFKKHETVIGKNVMIGSGVNLVAPVAVKDGAFVAAGSTITENVPSDALAIAREPVKIRKGWAAENRKRKARK